MSETATTTPTPAGGARLGERVRALRVAAGMTQVELAGGRFSKEYISQIERGKTRPTQATVAWLAERLGVDQGFLAVGVSTEDRTKVEALLARAEALSEAHKYSEAIEAFTEIDQDTADLCTEISRAADKDLWFVEAHLGGKGARTATKR